MTASVPDACSPTKVRSRTAAQKKTYQKLNAASACLMVITGSNMIGVLVASRRDLEYAY
jgi:hypothetical protein